MFPFFTDILKQGGIAMLAVAVQTMGFYLVTKTLWVRHEQALKRAEEQIDRLTLELARLNEKRIQDVHEQRERAIDLALKVTTAISQQAQFFEWLKSGGGPQK